MSGKWWATDRSTGSEAEWALAGLIGDWGAFLRRATNTVHSCWKGASGIRLTSSFIKISERFFKRFLLSAATHTHNEGFWKECMTHISLNSPSHRSIPSLLINPKTTVVMCSCEELATAAWTLLDCVPKKLMNTRLKERMSQEINWMIELPLLNECQRPLPVCEHQNILRSVASISAEIWSAETQERNWKLPTAEFFPPLLHWPAPPPLYLSTCR